MDKVLMIGVAFCLDLLLGDPYPWPHPVKLIGHGITLFLRKSHYQRFSARGRYLLGGLLWILVVAVTGLVCWSALFVSFRLHPAMGVIVSIYLSYTTMATKSLAVEGKKIFQTLAQGTLLEARKQVGMIVGRDTTYLTEEEITKATIETIAENTSDGTVAPMLYLFLGGPVLAMMYKAVNTLDSMVGYQTPAYQEIGYVSAKMDDLWNYIPARVTWLLMIVSSGVSRLNMKHALQIGWRDRRNHKSPNSGYPEAVAAGALGIQLGGTHSYHGVEISKPCIGDANRCPAPIDILRMNQLLYICACLAYSVCAATTYLIIIR